MSPQELNDLLRANYPMIRTVCWRILHNEADTDDATQNALISIARRIDTFDGRSAISTWMYRIATNAAIDELRRRQRRPRPTADEHFLSVADSSTERDLASIDSADYLSAAIQQVPEEFRIALVLRDVADLDYEEIGRILGIPGGTVRSKIARGRARLADIVGNSPAPSERHTPRQTPGPEAKEL
jgi:RNA polymerase sigma-70 factor (ECF subfamily)